MVMPQHLQDLSNERGLVFNIERFCVHDGPGIRTIVFLKGCMLSCKWCANPEGIGKTPQMAFLPESCIGCGHCAEGCSEKATFRTSDGMISVNAQRCAHCGSCVAVCPSGARLMYGTSMSVGEVFEEVCKDLPFYRRSQGGVTVSGGEPLAQKSFTYSLLKYCSLHNIHTAVETCGYASWGTVSYAFEFADLILFDFKHIHPLKHLKFTGVNNQQILENLKRLDAEGRALIIRVPVIPGFNATIGEMEAMASFAAKLKNPHTCHLLPYHPLGNSKYSRFGRKPVFQPDDELSREQMQEFLSIWESHGIKSQIGG
ncbi:MAG: glycyl-radical enzyme activating protein [Deltaproteobacteria bacterium]|nr:glycyl-radical enzyme activating protein [Deltaproteobacteria bacterium]